jgi:secreted trypsin-like serine protease
MKSSKSNDKMWKFLFLTFVTIFASTSKIRCEEISSFIVGGQNASVGQFPHMVSVLFFIPELNEHIPGAGGGILNRRWVLTVSFLF